MSIHKTFPITDAFGTRRITLEEFRADLDARKIEAKRIMDAWKSGNIQRTAEAQAEFRRKFCQPSR